MGGEVWGRKSGRMRERERVCVAQMVLQINGVNSKIALEP